MTIERSDGQNVPPTTPPGQSGGALSSAAAVGFAMAIGLLKGLGISYNKVLAAGNEAKAALAELIEVLEEIHKQCGTKGKLTPEQVRAELNALKPLLNKLKAALERIRNLTNKNAPWNKDFPPQGKGLQQSMDKFLKQLVQQVGQALEGCPVDWSKAGKNPISDWLAGKAPWGVVGKDWDKDLNYDDPSDSTGVPDAFRQWVLYPGKETGVEDAINKLFPIAASADSRYQSLASQANLNANTINSWLQVSEKSVQTLFKTLAQMISNI